MATQNENAPAAGTARGVEPKGDGLAFHCTAATAEPLLARLDGVQKVGNGWRARCPSCGGKSQKLSITVTNDRVLVHCFSCHDAEGVMSAVGLRWSDLQPPRNWPQSPEDRERARRAIRESGWSVALSVLATEGTILHLAALALSRGEPLAGPDVQRLALACVRIDRAALVLANQKTWKPDYCHPPGHLVRLKREALVELQRQAQDASIDLAAAELALEDHERARCAA